MAKEKGYHWQRFNFDQESTAQEAVEILLAKLDKEFKETRVAWSLAGFLLTPNILLLPKDDYYNFDLYKREQAAKSELNFERPEKHNCYLFNGAVVIEADVLNPVFLFVPGKDFGAL